MLGQTNNQTPIVRLAHEWRHVRIVFEGTLGRSEVNSCSCSWSIKKTTFKDKITPIDS